MWVSSKDLLEHPAEPSLHGQQPVRLVVISDSNLPARFQGGRTW